MSFNRSIVLSLVFIFFITLILPFIHLRHSIYEEKLSEVRSHSRRQLEAIELLLAENEEIKRAENLQPIVKALAQKLNVRISYLSRDGTLLADSAVLLKDLPRKESLPKMPEIEEAINKITGFSKRYDNILHMDFIYVAKKLEGIGGLEDGILRIGRPYSQIRDWISSILKERIYLIFLGLLLIILLSWFLSRRLKKEVERISLAAEEVGKKDFSRRLDFKTLKEFVPLMRTINRMANRNQKFFTDLSEQKEEVEAILDGLSEGLLVLDTQGKVKIANKAVENIFSVSTPLVGKETIEFIRSPELHDTVRSFVINKDQHSKHMIIYLPGMRYFEVNIIPLALRPQREQEIILVLHEITELKRLEQIRKDFVANISHELRTPLTSIKGYTETLLSMESFDQSIKNFLIVIKKNADNMSKLLEDLLQLSRLESGEKTASSEPVDLGSTLIKAWEVCMPLAQEKNISLKNELPASLWVLGDSQQFLRVLINLLDNAIKFSPEGEWIKVYAREKGKYWLISVQDNGPGIPAFYRIRVFERFYRLEKSRKQDEVSGSGLGLSICKHIIQKHGGEIWVESPAKETLKGSVFHFTLPKAESKDKENEVT